MCFYPVGTSSAGIIEFKRLVNITLVEPLPGKLENISSRIVFYEDWSREDRIRYLDKYSTIVLGKIVPGISRPKVLFQKLNVKKGEKR